MKFLFIFLGVTLLFSNASAISNSAKYDIEINEQIPDIEVLRRDNLNKNSEYDRHFSFRWNMPDEFDSSFKSFYQTLADDERHLASLTENQIFEMVRNMPKELYPYIGPHLHTLPQLSGRVLDIQGIKETKNQFPQQISADLQDIENIEYVSPYMYIYMVPQELLQSLDIREYPEFDVPEYHSLKKPNINPEFLKDVVNQTPLSDYADGKNRQKNEGIRNYISNKNTPLSGADVQAFAATLSDLKEFNHSNSLQLIKTNFLISEWEEKNGLPKDFYFYKQMANPCHSIVRSIKWSNKTLEFQKIIGKKGFGLEDWALTCDKTLKAYRRANISEAMAIMLYGLKTNQHLQYYKESGLKPDEMQILENISGATVEMYRATQKDVETVKPLMNKIYRALPKSNPYFLGSPFIFY